jgi:hypothetical protein
MRFSAVSADTDVTCAQGINKAFVISDADLSHFFETGKRWVERDGVHNSVILCRAALRNSSDALTSDEIDTLLKYRNPKRNEITEISLEMASEDKDRTFEVDFRSYEYPDLIRVRIGGEDAADTENQFNRALAELKDITQWYWFLAGRRWLARLSTWFFWLFVVFTLVFNTLLVIGAVYDHYQAPDERSRPRGRYRSVLIQPGDDQRGVKENVHEEPRAKRQDLEILAVIWRFIWSKQFWAGLGVVGGGICLERIVAHLFPKAVFEIGRGKDRHQRLKKMRKWMGGLLTAVILTGIIVPIVNKFVMRLF